MHALHGDASHTKDGLPNEGHDRHAGTAAVCSIGLHSDPNRRVPQDDGRKSYKSAVAGGGGGNNNGTRVNKFGVLQWDKQHKCKNCDKYVFHFEQDCHSLPENKAKKAEFDRKCKEERSKTPNK